MGLWDNIKSFLFGKPKDSDQMSGMFLGMYPGSNGAPPTRGTHELLEAYNTMPWLRAVVDKVSRSVASTGWHLYVVTDNGKAIKSANVQHASFETRGRYLKQQGAVQEITEHPLLDLLNYGNSYMTGVTVRQLIQIYLDLTGEAFLLKERNKAGTPIALWPLPPDWVVSIPTADKPFYRVSYRGLNEEIPVSEVLWISEPDPVNPYGRGSGMARSLGDELETDEYAAKHTKSWFYNRARPDVIISAEGLTPEDTKRLEQDWLNK
ncbi:MAG TPA: phage portal protein, partial [Fervidobacterium sp.]|nr:phage portal protein [Fervidobacterium sp.]